MHFRSADNQGVEVGVLQQERHEGQSSADLENRFVTGNETTNSEPLAAQSASNSDLAVLRVLQED